MQFSKPQHIQCLQEYALDLNHNSSPPPLLWQPKCRFLYLPRPLFLILKELLKTLLTFEIMSRNKPSSCQWLAWMAHPCLLQSLHPGISALGHLRRIWGTASLLAKPENAGSWLQDSAVIKSDQYSFIQTGREFFTRFSQFVSQQGWITLPTFLPMKNLLESRLCALNWIWALLSMREGESHLGTKNMSACDISDVANPSYDVSLSSLHEIFYCLNRYSISPCRKNGTCKASIMQEAAS